MDIKEIALKVADSLRNKVDGISHMQSNQGLVRFAEALIESYKAELLKEVTSKDVLGEPVAYFSDEFFSINTKQNATFNDPLFSSDQVAAAVLKATKSLDKPIDPSLSAEIERTDWTPAEALQFYADQRNFDIVSGHARIIDNGAVASNALKHLSIERLELKGDAELAELRAQLAAAQEEIERLKHSLKLEQQLSDSLKMAARMPGTGNYVDWIKTIRNSHDQLAKAEQLWQVTQGRCDGLEEKLAKTEHRVAEACALQVATETRFHWLDAARVAKEIRSGEWRKFVKEM